MTGWLITLVAQPRGLRQQVTDSDLPLQKEAESQLAGPIKEPHREACPASSYQLPASMFLGRFLKPYFKDKLTGLVRQAGRQTGKETGSQSVRENETGRQSVRQNNRQTDSLSR